MSVTISFIDRVLSGGQSSSKDSVINLEIIASSQVGAACLSLVSSTTMAIMIAKTEKGLTTPYRRIIFGLSISDILQSLAFVLGPFSIPSDVEDSWGIGNQGTCQADGLILVIGMAAVPMYTCFLCYYYLCKLKFRMENDVFAHRREWKIHAFIILYNVAMGTASLAMDTLHPAIFKTLCAHAPPPLGCRIYPELVGECEPVIFSRVNKMVFLNNFVLLGACLFGMIWMMSMLYYHAMVLNRMSPRSSTISEAARPNQVSRRRGVVVEDVDNSMVSTIITVAETSGHVASLRPSPPSHRDGNGDVNANVQVLTESSLDHEQSPSQLPEEIMEARPSPIPRHRGVEDVEDGNPNLQMESSIEQEQQSLSQPQAAEVEESIPTQGQVQQNQARQLSTLYRNETLIQGCLYVGCFFAVYLPSFIIYVYGMANKAPPKYLQFTLFFLLPLGGVLNILVYTRPQAASLHRNHPELSRSRCLWLVLRAGGELPTINPNPNNGPDNFLNVSPPPPMQQESMSEVQIGLATRPPSELEISGFRSNLGTNGMSLSFGTSHPDYNLDDNWSYVPEHSSGRPTGGGMNMNMTAVDKRTPTSTQTNAHTNTQNLESIQ